MSDDDKDQSLLQLSRHHGASIVSQLVDIGSESNQQKHLKVRSFIDNLQCLQPIGLELRRRSIDASREQRYVALSYTWTPSEHENPEPPEPGWYPVENWDNKGVKPSSVRKCVLDRVIRYMRHADVSFLWIDVHCIRQDTCGSDACVRHSHCIEKRDSIQAMDLVYQLSKHPVALLGRRLRSESELYLLERILAGDLVAGDPEFRLSAAKDIDVAREALSLLNEITQDSWWCRAWTFQENYRGGTRMQLLIGHDKSLESQKQRCREFGEIPEELCIPSVTFSTQATRLCLALRAEAGLSPLEVERIDRVLQAAGRYALILRGSNSMTPTVIADIETRGLSKPWDRLAIVANCCQYRVRLDGGALSQQCCSPSLSVLAMSLLNGEILDNGNDEIASVAELTASKFLNKLMFQAFKAPGGDTRPLTFNKGCRLIDVKLMAGGIATSGHLCTFTDLYLHRMAVELADAILTRRKLRLGIIWDKGQSAPYSAIFVWSGQGGNGPYPLPSDFVFTSVRQGDLGSDIYDANDIDCHVSLVVDIESPFGGGGGGGGVQRLRVHDWLLGICFFDGCPRTEVVFPWPISLQAVRP
ncbi:hypothetical protein RB595_001816 [Gaeumannomyces hyphopodioides]